MSKTIYNQFSKDLLRLYCSIKHPAVEDALIRFAATQDQDFCVWLTLNKKNVLSGVKNPEVVETLEFLCHIKSKFDFTANMSYGDNRGNFFAYISNGKVPRFNLDIIYHLDSIVKQTAIEILTPFSTVINSLVYSIFPQSISQMTDDTKTRKSNRAEILSDLKVINSMYQTVDEINAPEVAPTIKQQRREMVVNLLGMFSSDIAAAYEANDMEDIANAFRNKALAKAPQYGIMKLLPVPPLSWDKIHLVKTMVGQVWSRYDVKMTQYNHDNVATTFLSAAGTISSEDYQRIHAAYETHKNPLGLPSDHNAGMNLESQIPTDAHMNPVYIHMLALFFNYMQVKMGII